MPDSTEVPAATSHRDQTAVFSFIFRCLLLLALLGLAWWFSKPIESLLQNLARLKYGELEVSVQLTDDSRHVLNALLSEITETTAWDDVRKIEKLEDLLIRYERFIETTIITEANAGAARGAYDKIFVQLLDGNISAARSSLDDLYTRYPTYWNVDEIRRMVATLPPKPEDEGLRTLYADIAANCKWGADPTLLKRMSEAAGSAKPPKRSGCGKPIINPGTTP